MFIICLCSLICLIVQQLCDSVWLQGRVRMAGGGGEILSIEFRISFGISFSVESVIEFAYRAPQSLGQLSLYFGSATVLFSIEGKGESLHKCHGQQQQQQITTMTDLHLFLFFFCCILATLRSVTQYQLKPQPQYLKNPLSSRQGYLSATCSTWPATSNLVSGTGRGRATDSDCGCGTSLWPLLRAATGAHRWRRR